MAELGDDLLISGGGNSRNVDVSVDMMDYAYVDGCDDVSTIRAILRKLKQEEGGRFPELERHVEQKLLAILPEKERSRIMRLRTRPDPGDVKAAQEELAKWQESVRKIDAERSKGRGKAAIPPPRGKEATPSAGRPTGHGGTAVASAPEASGKRISGYDFQAWERFDVDAAIEEIDSAEESKQRKVEDAVEAANRVAKERQQRRQRELEEALESMRAEDLSAAEATMRATREKQKGNECYRAGEIDEAQMFYTKALALLSLAGGSDDPELHRQQKAILYCNRAMTNIKLEQLPKAEQDCDDALALDPAYLKARQRRGIIRHKRGKYLGAIEDFEEALRANPNAKDVGKLLLVTRRKLEELGGGIDGRSKASQNGKALEPVRTTLKKKESEKENRTEEVVEVPVRKGADLTPLADADATSVVSNAPLEAWQGELPEPRRSSANGKSTSDLNNGEALDFTKIAIEEEEGEAPEPERSAEASKSPAAVPRAESREFTRITIEEDSEPEGDGEATASGEAEAELESQAVAPLNPESKEAETEVARQGERPNGSTAIEQDVAAAAVDADEASAAAAASAADADAAADADSDEDEASAAAADGAEDSGEETEGGHAGRGWRSKGRSTLRMGAPSSSGDRLDFWKSKLSKSTSTRAKERAEQRKASDAEKRMGNDLLKTGDVVGAINAYSSAIRLDPSNVAVLNNRAHAKLKVGDFQGAFDDADDVVREEPENLKARYRRGLAAVELGQVQEGLDDFKMVLSVQPNDKLALQALADAEQRVGGASNGDLPQDVVPESNDKAEHDDTVQRTEAAEKAKNEGNALVAKGQFEEGVAAYTEALRLDPDMWVAKNNRSQAYLKVGTAAALRSGMQDATDVLAVQPDNCKALYRRAFAALELVKSSGDQELLDSCVLDLERLLELSPGNKSAQKALMNARKVERSAVTAKKPKRPVVQPTLLDVPSEEEKLGFTTVDGRGSSAPPAPVIATQAPRPGDRQLNATKAANKKSPQSAAAVNERIQAAMQKAKDRLRSPDVDIPPPPKSLYEFER
eukprot:scaffold489_cov259-Pinguiococcus_pyrenoidosus.AAC.37